MGIHKHYEGYRSFQYLEEEIDYKGFTLAKEIGRVPSHLIPVSDTQEKRVNAILGRDIVISLHDHLFVTPENMAELFPYVREGRFPMGYEGLSVSAMDAVFGNLMDGLSIITSRMGWKWTDVIHDLGMRLCDIAHQDFVIRCEGVEDIVNAFETGKVAFVPALESSTMIENEIDRIDILYGLGVRMMGIVYSESNALGSGLREKIDGGLNYLGRAAVKRMNKLGMAIDISHAGDQTSLDVIEASAKPVFITHTGARALWNTRRMKPDEVVKACAEKGGVIAVEAAPHTTITKKHPEQSIESYMEHFEYLVDLVGVDHVAFGPDTLFGDHVGLHHAFSAHLSIKEAFIGEKVKEVPYVDGLENPAENFPNIVRWLIKRDKSDDEIGKAIGGNALRVLKEIW